MEHNKPEFIDDMPEDTSVDESRREYYAQEIKKALDDVKFEVKLARKDAEILTFKSFVFWLSQRHEHDGLTKGQIIRMAAKLADGGTWQDDHVKYDGRTAVEVLDAEIAALKQERDALFKVREAADVLAASMEDCHMCETPCESYQFSLRYREARHA